MFVAVCAYCALTTETSYFLFDRSFVLVETLDFFCFSVIDMIDKGF
jgi:hypothetical protein